jgi:hypothetical protein
MVQTKASKNKTAKKHFSTPSIQATKIQKHSDTCTWSTVLAMIQDSVYTSNKSRE